MAESGKKLKNGEIGVQVQKEDLIWRDRKRIIFGLPWSFTVYKLTPSRLIVEKGFLSKHVDEIRLYRITDLQYNQTFFNRIFGIGSVKLVSSDASLPFFEIERVKKADQVKELLSQTVEVARRENGVRTSELVGGGPHMAPPPAGDPGAAPGTAAGAAAGAAVGTAAGIAAGASMGPGMFPDYNHDGIDDRTQ